ncbi:oxygenase MpaB family protein [Undibacterium sp.]|uniref:oxygenase MpaB family protein n=1 Tax=Undibacterium sp. TaxID=1914977 RepID=UPI0025F9BEC2|nr:oxygenase MpaB family protein [Undibacterium sp.]
MKFLISAVPKLSYLICSIVLLAFAWHSHDLLLMLIAAALVLSIPLFKLNSSFKKQGKKKAAILQYQLSDQQLTQARILADPLADNTIQSLLGDWPQAAENVSYSPLEHSVQWQTIASINRQFDEWKTNADIALWPAGTARPESAIEQHLQAYLQAGLALPDWAEPAKIERAETLFMEYGALSCSLLFCSSLPECYVLPDLSAVLHAAGQLEQHTDHRIRSTAAMIFPVMMRGGLCQADGSGVAQILKVRLIHATIRNLILRGSPEHAMDHFNQHIQPLALNNSANLFHTLFAHGWNLERAGLPCNQTELAYTLLTFGYVFLRSMRKLGLGLASEDELAFLHLWNVVGHILGIRRELMADTMQQAEVLFQQMQALPSSEQISPDPRPRLGQALMQSMEQVIPFPLFKAFPVLMTRYLCGTSNAKKIGVNQRVSWLSHKLFILLMLLVRGIDTFVRYFSPEFSISRLITRVLGYHFMSKILLDQTRPLKLPEQLLNQVNQTIGTWSTDHKSAPWMNALEKKMTTTGSWNQAD